MVIKRQLKNQKSKIKITIQNPKFSGRVIHGDGYGKILGFPTANIDRRDYIRRKLKIKLGIWAGWAEFKLKAKSYKLKAAMVIGPIDKKGLPKIEAHLIGFKGGLYGRILNIYLNIFIRPFKKFKNTEELKRQIKKDIKKISKKMYGK